MVSLPLDLTAPMLMHVERFLGSIIAAWTTFGTFHIPNSWSWRIPSALQGLPSVLQVFMIWFVPESPRWLMSKGR